MADNVELDPGTGGAVIATDDDGTAQHQYVKVEFGGDGTFTKVTTSAGLPSDPLDRAARDCGKVDIAMGQVAHDAAAAAIDPVLVGGYASAAAPTNVSADGDAVQQWHLRNGAQCVNVTAAGALIGGDATNGIDVDVTRVTGTVTIAGAVTNAGTFAVQIDAGAVTSLALLDDTIATLGTTTYTEATTKGSIVGAVRRDADTTLADTTNEVAPLIVDARGCLKVEAFSGETLPVSLTSTTVTGTVAVTQSGTWDEVGINDSGNSITVDNGGTFAVQVDGAALTAVQKIDDPVLVDDAAFTPATSSVMMAGFEADEGSTDSVDEGDAGAARMTLDRKQIVTLQPHTTGGLSIYRSLDVDETDSKDVKTSAGQLYGMWVTNTTTATIWVKFYNATAANTTVGSTTPVITVGVPGNTSDDVSGLFSSANGITFDTAISVAATTGVADADTGAPSANALIINVFYK